MAVKTEIVGDTTYWNGVPMPHVTPGVVAGEWRLTRTFHFAGVLDDGRVFEIWIREGFTFDGASIPRSLWRVCGAPMEIPRIAAALIHDWLYRAQVCDRALADEVFNYVCKRVGMASWRTGPEWAALRAFGGGEVPEEFDLYLQPGAKAEFGIDKSKLTDPVLVASVKGKMVKGVVESALVFSASGAPHPWELRRFYDEPEAGGEPVPVWRVWIPSAAITFVHGSVTRKVVYDSGSSGPDPSVNYKVEGGSSSAMWGAGNFTGEKDGERTAAAMASGLSGVWAAAPVPDGGGSVYIRIFSADGDAFSAAIELTNVLPGGRDATVNHPVSLSDEGFYIRIASVDDDGVVTQCVRSMLSLTVLQGGLVQKLITGGNGISVVETEGRIQISVTGGGGSSDGGGSTGGGKDSGTGISGTFVFATVPRYDEASHRLLYTPVSLTFANGSLTAMEAGAETVIAQAVEESA